MIYGRLYTRSLGVHIGCDHVRAVELVRLGRWILRGRIWCLPSGDRLPEALSELATRVRRATLRVVTHLDPAHIRAAVKDAAVEEVGGRPCSEGMTAGLLPTGVRREAFAATYRVLHVDESRARVAIAVAARRAVEARLAQISEAGLEAAFVGVAALEAAGAGAFDRSFRERCQTLVIEHDGAHQVVEFREGAIESLRPISTTEAESLLADGGPGVWLAPCGPSQHEPHLVSLLHPLAGVRRAEPIDTTFTLAAGLAMRGLYLEPGRDGEGSFLESEAARDLHYAHEERVGKRLTVALASVVLLVLSALSLADAHFSHRLSLAEAAMASVADLLATLDDEQIRTDRLHAEVRAAEERVGSRTQTASAMAVTAAISPEGVRWRELNLSVEGVSFPRLTLRGLARADTSLAVFLRDLENAQLTSDVRLVIAESVVPGVGTGRGLPLGPALRRFEIHAEMPAVAGGSITGSDDTGG